jgi:hypothetical protein
MDNKYKTFISIFIFLILIGLYGINLISFTAYAEETYIDDHVQFSIWQYENVLNKPINPLILELSQKNWQASVAASITPAFVNRLDVIGLLFDDGTENNDFSIDHDTESVNNFGMDKTSASAKIASTYWSKAEIVVVADTYEHILWGIPIASFLTAPILIEPKDSTLDVLGTKCAILIGEKSNAQADEVIKLDSLEKLWQFQLELYDTKGQICNYVVVTNPYDAEDVLDENINYPFMSLASAPLIAYHNALVQSNDYTSDKEILDQIHKSPTKDDALYQKVKPYFEKVKTDSYKIEKFMIDNGHTPKSIALVGGTFALPDYYFDIHVKYKYWDQEVHYVPSASPYGNLTPEMPTEKAVNEDMGIGRIVGHSLFDVSFQLFRTFFYNEFLPGGKYYNIMPANWQNKALLIDGHRQNQPREGGIQNCSAKEPFPPSDEVTTVFEESDFETEYYTPRNESDPTDTNFSVGVILDKTESSSMVQYIAHGGSMGNPKMMWMEVGYDPVTGEEGKHYLTKNDIITRTLPPSIYHIIACHTGHIFLDIDPADTLPSAFIHAGAVAYIAPVTCQMICFWEGAPYGVAATQSELFWQKIMNQNIPIGIALAEAKWEAYNKWDMPNDLRDEPDGPAFHLFGDPAFEPYKPIKQYNAVNKFNIIINYEKPKSGKTFDINLNVLDMDTKQSVFDTEINAKFDGKLYFGPDLQITAPSDDGSYQLIITINKEGYQQIDAKYWVNVEKSTSKGVIPGFESGLIIFAASFIMLTIYKRLLDKKRNKIVR